MFIDSIHNNRIFCLKNSELFRLVASNRDLSVSWIELQTNVREDFTITEKAPNWAFFWLKGW